MFKKNAEHEDVTNVHWTALHTEFLNGAYILHKSQILYGLPNSDQRDQWYSGKPQYKKK